MTNIGKTARELAAEAIFKSGSFKVDLAEGFKIALHDALPEAPRSPFYLNLRKQGVKGGTMTDDDISTIALSMHDTSLQGRLFHIQRPVCSIPAAGDPFLDSMEAMYPGYPTFKQPTRFRLEKDESTGKRKIKLADTDTKAWKQTLLIDDLVTSMLTKQLAIDAIKASGGTVTALLVFLNRSTDAKENLARQGIKLYCVWEFADMMEWALGQSYLTRQQYEIIMEYPDKLAAYKRSVGYFN